MQPPPRPPAGPDAQATAGARSDQPALAPASCDLSLRLGSESGRRLLSDGEAGGRALDASGAAVWAPLSSGKVAFAWLVESGTSGLLAGPLDFLEQARGPLREVVALDAEAPGACCGTRLLVELAADGVALRALLHRPHDGPSREISRLRPGYAPREASDWAVCEWNSLLLDPLEAAGVLFLDARRSGTGSAQAFVLWQDVDCVPRGWEACAELPRPSLLRAAPSGHFRYAARDRELLVVDRSPTRPLGHDGPLAEERVATAPFARPPLPDSHGC